jgi:hypothetical protein
VRADLATPIRARPRIARADDRGEVAANTVVAVAILGLFFLVIQAGLWFNANQVASGAARHALDAARVENGTAEDGEAIARQFLDQTGSLQDVHVSVSREADLVTVTVSGTAWSPQPFIEPHVSVTLTAPVERVIQ